MAQKKVSRAPAKKANFGAKASSSVDELLALALEKGNDHLETGRYIVTFKDGASDAGLKLFKSEGLRVANARDFNDGAAGSEAVGDADAVMFPEIGSAILSGHLAQRGFVSQAGIAADSPYESVDPEYFVFPESLSEGFIGGLGLTKEKTSSDYLRGFLEAAGKIATEFGYDTAQAGDEEEVGLESLGHTWGLIACKVPPSVRSGRGIKLAFLDSGIPTHPDFIGRHIVGATFVGQPVNNAHPHAISVIGTACGPKTPPGTTPRYGIGYRTSIFVAKVLSNMGTGTTATVLAGMNWAVVQRCPVINISLGSSAPVQPSYTAAGQAALNNGCLMIAASGSAASAVGAPANSPTIMSVASLDQSLRPASFSNFGKIEISGPGRDIFSAATMPQRYSITSGSSMSTAHVSGCAALWAETSANLRGIHLWRKLQATARRLPFPISRVGAGLVQAP